MNRLNRLIVRFLCGQQVPPGSWSRDCSSKSPEIECRGTRALDICRGGPDRGGGGTLGGSGRIYGNTTVGGIFAPGNSPGTLTFLNHLSLTGTSTTQMQIAGFKEDSEYDSIDVGGNGRSAVDRASQWLHRFGGDTFNLFDANTLTGSFSGFVQPALQNGLTWNTSALSTTGVISVVPEPSALALTMLVGLGFASRRRR